jgi:uncharacterized protein YjbI with pentapeptide repeats
MLNWNVRVRRWHARKIEPADLSGADLRGKHLSKAYLFKADLSGANLRDASLFEADLHEAILTEADLSRAGLHEANLSDAKLSGANLSEANLSDADLSGANLGGAILTEADLSRVNLHKANLSGADLRRADLSAASLRGADLIAANLRRADLTAANLGGANLSAAVLVETNLADAVLTGCRIYGVSAWNLKLEGTKQNDLVITRGDEPEVTVDNIEVAQFVYLLLHNEKLRDVIETITSKVVLILGRFAPERKAVLEAIRGELRRRAYVPILFDFDVPATRDITETVSLLARMARFIVADLTDPSSVPKELEAIVPHLAVPVQPLLEGERPYAMFKDYWKYDWVLPVQRYESVTSLIETGANKFIEAAELKMNELADKRRRFEAELVGSGQK